MKRRAQIIGVLLIILAGAALSFPAAAGLLDDLSPNPCDVCEFAKLIGNIKNLVILIGEPLAALFIVVGGILITVSAGNQQLREQGKKTVTGGIIGLCIVFLAWIIVTAVLTATLGLSFDTNIWTITCPEDTTCEEYAGPEPEPNPAGCGSGSAEKARAHIGTCWGPCHCAHFVSSVLVETGCTGAFNTSVAGLEEWLQRHGWERVTSPQAGDIGVDFASHVGVMTSSSTTIHSKVMNDDGSNTACAGKCGRLYPSCPDCQGAAGDPRGSYESQNCTSNQCVTEETKRWDRYWRPPAEDQQN